MTCNQQAASSEIFTFEKHGEIVAKVGSEDAHDTGSLVVTLLSV